MHLLIDSAMPAKVGTALGALMLAAQVVPWLDASGQLVGLGVIGTAMVWAYRVVRKAQDDRVRAYRVMVEELRTENERLREMAYPERQGSQDRKAEEA